VHLFNSIFIFVCVLLKILFIISNGIILACLKSVEYVVCVCYSSHL